MIDVGEVLCGTVEGLYCPSCGGDFVFVKRKYKIKHNDYMCNFYLDMICGDCGELWVEEF